MKGEMKTKQLKLLKLSLWAHKERSKEGLKFAI